MRPLSELRLRALGQLRLTGAPARLVERLFGPVWGPRVQRLGQHALRRAAARFPGLAELVGITAVQRSAPIERAEEPAPAAPTTAARALWLLANDPAWEVRARAAAEPALTRVSSAIEGLIQALEDPSAEVAAAAILTLGQSDDARVEPALQRVLANRSGFYSPIVRAAAVQSLALLLPASEAALAEALTDVDAEVSLAAIAAIAEHAPERASVLLSPMLTDRTGYFLPLVRLTAARALSKIGVPHALSRELCATERDGAVREVLEQAARALN